MTSNSKPLRSTALMQLTLARLREFYRQPEAVFWVYFFPILMVVALGIAFRNKPVERITDDVVASERAQPILDALQKDERIVAAIYAAEECQQRLRTGKSDLTVAAENEKKVGFTLDPTRPGSVLAQDLSNRMIQEAAGRSDPVPTTTSEVTEPGGRYIDFLVPGLLGMGLMGGGLWGVGFAIVDMRIRKLLKRLVATPMKKSQFLLGIMFSRLLFMVPEIILLMAFSWYFFGVQIYGSWLAIGFLVLLGAAEFSGIGLLVASRAKTMESVSGLMNLVMLPMWTLSGIFFSYERFPDIVQPVIKLLPLTPLNDSLRAVMLEGTSLIALWPQLILMFLWGAVTFAIALLVFRWND